MTNSKKISIKHEKNNCKLILHYFEVVGWMIEDIQLINVLLQQFSGKKLSLLHLV